MEEHCPWCKKKPIDLGCGDYLDAHIETVDHVYEYFSTPRVQIKIIELFRVYNSCTNYTKVGLGRILAKIINTNKSYYVFKQLFYHTNVWLGWLGIHRIYAI